MLAHLRARSFARAGFLLTTGEQGQSFTWFWVPVGVGSDSWRIGTLNGSVKNAARSPIKPTLKPKNNTLKYFYTGCPKIFPFF